MNIGVVRIKKDDRLEGNRAKEWLQLVLRPPFMESETMTMLKNLKKQKDSEPEYKIYRNYCRRGEKFRPVEAGALWRKTSSKNEVYFAGYVDNPLMDDGKMNIVLFETKVFEREIAADINWIYDVYFKTANRKVSDEELEAYK